MDGSDIINVFLLVLLIILSSYFSMSETAFTSANRIRLKNEAENGDKKAEKTLSLAENFDAVLSTILIGNNIANIALTAVATVIFVGWFPEYGATISTIVTTIVVVIFGEITPKSIAKEKAEPLAKFSTPSLRFFMFLFKPAILFFEKWKSLLDKVFKFEKHEGISEDELLSMVDEAESGGSIEDHEHRLVRSAIEFDDLEVSTIITPRVDVIGCEINDEDEKIEDLFYTHNFSRLIVYENSIDNVIGVLHEKDFNRYLKAKQKNKTNDSLLSAVKNVIFVQPNMNLSMLLRKMQVEKTHMAIVADEHGGMIGIATMEDALEELVGEIWDESDTIEKEIKEIVKGTSYEVKGTANLNKIFDLFGLTNQNEFMSNTISGFVIETLGHLPIEGETFDYQNMHVTINHVRNRRVLDIQIDYIDQD